MRRRMWVDAIVAGANLSGIARVRAYLWWSGSEADASGLADALRRHMKVEAERSARGERTEEIRIEIDGEKFERAVVLEWEA